MAKATTKIISTSRPVKASCKNTKVRTAAGACAPERKPMMKSGGTSPFGILSIIAGIDKNPKPTAADRISGAKMGTKKMAVGGTTESCGPGKPKGCGYAKAQRKNRRSANMSKVGPVVAKVLTTAATIGGLAYGAMKGKKMLENKKVGGAVKKSLPKAQVGSIVTDNTRVNNPYKTRYPVMSNKKKDPEQLTRKELDALSHQRRGMGESYGSYVKKSGSVMNELGQLKPKQQTQLNKYMSKASLGKKIYEALPNVGRIVGSSAADIPKGSKLEKQKLGGTTHPGFKAVQSKIAAKQGISKEAAGAILASSTRKASAKAKAVNPRLKKVK
jgi:hypothetical protein